MRRSSARLRFCSILACCAGVSLDGVAVADGLAFADGEAAASFDADLASAVAGVMFLRYGFVLGGVLGFVLGALAPTGEIT